MSSCIHFYKAVPCSHINLNSIVTYIIFSNHKKSFCLFFFKESTVNWLINRKFFRCNLKFVLEISSYYKDYLTPIWESFCWYVFQAPYKDHSVIPNKITFYRPYPNPALPSILLSLYIVSATFPNLMNQYWYKTEHIFSIQPVDGHEGRNQGENSREIIQGRYAFTYSSCILSGRFSSFDCYNESEMWSLYWKFVFQIPRRRQNLRSLL